jgi:hypothetical protein
MRAAPLRERIDKATLERFYWDEGLSTIEIAERYGSYSPSVIELMKKYEIPGRSKRAGER